MYENNFSQFSIESILFDKTKELSSLGRALPGLSLSSVALPQWPMKPVKSTRASAHQTFRCHRERKQQIASPQSSLSPPSTASLSPPSFSSSPSSAPLQSPAPQSSPSRALSSLQPHHNAQPHYDPQYQNPQCQDSQYQDPQYQDSWFLDSQHQDFQHKDSQVSQYQDSQYQDSQYQESQYRNSQYCDSQHMDSQYYDSQHHNLPKFDSRHPGQHHSKSQQLSELQHYDSQRHVQQRFEPLAPGSPPQSRAEPAPIWAASPSANAWPKPVCNHAAHAELGWCSWDRWSRGSMDSTMSEGLTTASTISDSVIEPADDEVTLISRPGSPRAHKSVSVAEPRTPRPCLQPAKTGYALWVGNLSAHTTLMDLRDLFGTPEIQSIYLIQRTGCAFVNYSSGAALDAGIELFYRRNGKLHDHELVIKAQRVDEDQQCAQTVQAPVTSRDRFFICKSLTIEDLETAKQKGLWSTQLRNRDKFNEAFNQAENVYLVFSANRTSAFYGFARLETPFGDDLSRDDGADAFDPAHSPDSGFEISRTPATYDAEKGMYVPAGEIVLDPLRGSQFWKVDGCPYAESDTEKWAAPAKITWLSSPNTLVPFSRTRQLKNSLNQNKPVKVARDGTEIDPVVGRELCDMFH